MVAGRHQPPDEKREAAPEDPLQRVSLVHDDYRQLRQKRSHGGHRQARHEPCLAHVGRHHEDPGGRENRLALARRNGTVDAPDRGFIQSELAGQLLPAAELVLDERTERVEDNHAALWVLQNPVKGERLKHKALARGGAGRHDDVLATAQSLERSRLVQPEAPTELVRKVGAESRLEQELRYLLVPGDTPGDLQGLDDGEVGSVEQRSNRVVHVTPSLPTPRTAGERAPRRVIPRGAL